MALCTNCGFQLKEDAKFCENCGQAVPAAGTTAAEPVEIPAVAELARRPPRRVLRKVVVAVLAVYL
jgi:uncharacterized membrane protein YvbJ